MTAEVSLDLYIVKVTAIETLLYQFGFVITGGGGVGWGLGVGGDVCLYMPSVQHRL